MSPKENKSSTYPLVEVKYPSEQFNHCEQETQNRCAFVIVDDWRYGDGNPFCDAPALAGRAYCARHWALCNAGADGREAEPAETAGPPAEFAHLEPVDVSEPVEPSETPAEFDLPTGGVDGEV